MVGSHCLWGLCVLSLVCNALRTITYPFQFCNYLDKEKRAGCFTLTVSMVSCD